MAEAAPLIATSIFSTAAAKTLAPKPKGPSAAEKDALAQRERSAAARDKSLSDQIRARLGASQGGTGSSLLFGSFTGVPQKKVLGP